MAYIIKAVLGTTSTEYYQNTNDSPVNNNLLATNIVLTNLTGSVVQASLSFYNEDEGEIFESGAVVFERDIPANESIEVRDRYLAIDDKIFALASAVDSIAMSIDIVGVDGRYIPPAP